MYSFHVRSRTPKTLSSSDCAYRAGLVDGEGTITLTRKHAHENRQLCLSISSTETALLDFVVQKTGAAAVRTGNAQT